MHDELYITMNFNFKIQQYQTEAVAAVTDVFTGQGFHDAVTYIHDRGKTPFLPNVQTADCEDVGDDTAENDTGYKNERILISDEQLLQNIQRIQNRDNIQQSASLIAVLNIAKAGDDVVASSTLYGGTFNLLNTTLRKLGINTIFVFNL